MLKPCIGRSIELVMNQRAWPVASSLWVTIVSYCLPGGHYVSDLASPSALFLSLISSLLKVG
jgi:hypothetical protein